MLVPQLNFIAGSLARIEVEREVALLEELHTLSRMDPQPVVNSPRSSDAHEDAEDALACEGWLLPPQARASSSFAAAEHRRRHAELEILSDKIPTVIANLVNNCGVDGVDELMGSMMPVLSPAWCDMYRATKDFADEALVCSKGLTVDDFTQCKGAFYDAVLAELGSDTASPAWLPPPAFFDPDAPHNRVFKLGADKRWFAEGGTAGGGAPRDVLAEIEALLFNDDHEEELAKEQLIYGNNGGTKARYTEVKRSALGPVRGRDVKEEAPGTAALLSMAKHNSPENRVSSHLRRRRGVGRNAAVSAPAGGFATDPDHSDDDDDTQAISKELRSELFKATRRWESLMIIWSKWVISLVLSKKVSPADAVASVGLGEFVRGYLNTVVHERTFLSLTKARRCLGSSSIDSVAETAPAPLDESSSFPVASSAGRRYVSPPPKPTSAPPSTRNMVPSNSVVVNGKQKSIRTLSDRERRLVLEEDAWLLSAGYDSSFLHTGIATPAERAQCVSLLQTQSSSKWLEVDEGSCRCIVVLQSYLRRRLAQRRAQAAIQALGAASTSRLSVASKRLSTAVQRHYAKQQPTQRSYVLSCLAIAKDTSTCENFYSSEEDSFKREFKVYMSKATEHYLHNVPLDADWVVEKVPTEQGTPELRYVNVRSGRSQMENPNMLKVAALKQRELAKVTRRREEAYREMEVFVQRLNDRKQQLAAQEQELSVPVTL